MPATPADIGAATRPGGAALETASSTAVQADWPNARDGSDAPARGFWDNPADAALVLADRFALLSQARRRFRVELEGLRFDLLPGIVTPAVRLVDAELAVDQPVLVSQVEIDLAHQRTIVELWG